MPNSKRHIVIASSDSFYRLGIQSVLNLIGVDAETKMVNAFSQLKDFASPQRYLIICEDVLELHKHQMALLKDWFKPQGVLVLSTKKRPTDDDFFWVSKDIEEKEIMAQFSTFFFERGDDAANENILTEREIDVLKKVAQGYANKEIADKLFISINTVITHRKNITEKLGIKTIAGLTVYALMNRLINLDEVRY